MAFNNKVKVTPLELGVVPSGIPTLHLSGRDHKSRIALSVDKNRWAQCIGLGAI